MKYIPIALYITLVQTFTLGNCFYKIRRHNSDSIQSKSFKSFRPRLGFPILSLSDTVGTPNVHNMTSTTGSGSPTQISTSDGLSSVISTLPALKLGLLTTALKFLEPLLKSFFITSLIILALSGTAAVLCTIIDCQANFGRQWLHPYTHSSSSLGNSAYDLPIIPATLGLKYNQQHSGSLFNNSDTFITRRKQEFSGKPFRNINVQSQKIDFVQHQLERNLKSQF